MKLAKASVTLGLMTLAGIASPCALAGNDGWYIGGNVGQSRSTIDNDGIKGGLQSGGFTTTSLANDNRDIGFKVFGGYQFIPYFALEGGYFNLGKFGFTAATQPPGALDGKIRLMGLNLDAVGILPIAAGFSALGRIGVDYTQARDTFSGSGSVNVTDPSRSKRAANYKFGLGLQYDITDSIGLRAEAERYRVNDAVGNHGDIDLFSAGLLYRFGSSTPAPVAAVAIPAYVAPAPLPPPPLPPPAPTKVSFSADSLFDFGKATVKPEGKQALDRFAADLKGTSFDRITVTGHTDRIGTSAYNTRLSTDRAEAVKDYLVASAGIAADRIAASGVDGSDPVTKPGDCREEHPARHRKASKQLIACLQPDRRVEVEVSGTK